MLPVHAVIGVVEGLVTAAVLGFVWHTQPDLLVTASAAEPVRGGIRTLLASLALAATATAGAVLWFASPAPDGLEWSIERVTGAAELPAPADAAWPDVDAGTSLAAGWFSFASILLRFALTVGAALLLVAGTGMFALCAALARLGVPRVLTLQLLFLYRYAFVLGDAAARMATARQLRGNGRRATLRSQGPLLGHLLLRAVDRARRVHQAMQARGFRGELHGLRTLRWRGHDTVFVRGWIGAFLALRAFDLPHWLGRTLLGPRVLVLHEGRLHADGPPARLFAEVALLKHCHLEPPLRWQRG